MQNIINSQASFIKAQVQKLVEGCNGILFRATLLCCLFLNFLSQAQVFPVVVTTTMRPPYSLSLADYANPTYDRIQTSLFMSDLSSVNYPVKLRLIVRGPGISLSTLPGQEVGPIFLNGGQTEILTGSEISGLFNPDKLQFQGITLQQYKKNAALPEGIYQIQFEVLDFNSNFVVSNVNLGFSSAWLILNDPPILNAPLNNATVEPTPLQSIFFQWTPRHTGSPNAAITTLYHMQMVEIYPSTRNANDAILSSPPIFETETYATSYNYTLADPNLLIGRWYAFRVKAQDANGLDLFKNQGYSEVFRFYYGYPCLPPSDLKAESLDGQSVLLSWKSSGNAEGSEVEYKKSKASYWTTFSANENTARISGLESGQAYTFRIRSACAGNTSEYSEETETTPNAGYGKACDLPLQEEVTAIEKNNSVTLTWKTQNWFDSYVFRYRVSGTSTYQEVSTQKPELILNNLEIKALYEYQLSYHCPEKNTWTEGSPGSFYITPSPDPGTGDCFPPMELHHEVSKNLSVEIFWPKDSESKGYWVYYQSTTASGWDSVYTTSNSVTLKNLTPQGQYRYYLKAVCKDNRLSIASEEHSFSVQHTGGGGGCPAPELREPLILNQGEVKLSWKAQPSYTGYLLEYKEEQAADWMAQTTEDTLLLLSRLDPGKKYRVRVFAYCGESKSDASAEKQFTTEAALEKEFVCGTTQNVLQITNKNSITLKPGDTFTAAGFSLKVKSLTGAGPYGGVAVASIPYLKHSALVFRMDKVRVNELNQLYEGKIFVQGAHLTAVDTALAARVTEILDRVDQNFTSLEEYLTTLDEYQDRINDYIGKAEGGNNTGYVKTGEVEVTESLNVAVSTADQFQSTKTSEGTCSLTITDDQGGKTNKSVTPPATIEEKNGIIFSVDKNCTVVKVAERIVLNQTSETLDMLSSKARVTFSETTSMKFGFSAWKDLYENSEEWKSRYQALGDYRVASKLMEPAERDAVKAMLSITDNSVDKSKLVFVSGKGVKYTFTSSGNDFTITLLGGPEDDAQEVYALYPKADGSFESFGKLLVPSYKHKKRSLVLVPVNGAKVETATIQTTFNNIFSQYGFEWTVTADENFTDLSWNLNADKDNALDVEGSGAFSTLTAEMKALNEAYSKSHTIDPTSVYLFVLKKAETADVAGDMPRAKQFGYLFTDGNSQEEQALTAAHEVGHGLYLLKHIFDGYGLEKKSLPHNLMDYAGGSQLDKLQWDVMHDPGVVLGVFERDEESKKYGRSKLPEKFANPDAEKTFTFLTPDGRFITLPSTVKNLIFSYGIPNVSHYNTKVISGSLIKFSIPDKNNNLINYKANIYDGQKSNSYDFWGYTGYDANLKEYQLTNKIYSEAFFNQYITYIPIEDSWQLTKVKTSHPLQPYSEDHHIILSEAQFPELLYNGGVEIESVKYPIYEYTYVSNETQLNIEYLKLLKNHSSKKEHLLLIKIIQLKTLHPSIFEKFTYTFDDWDQALPAFAYWDKKVQSDNDLKLKWKNNPIEFYNEFIKDFIQFIKSENEKKNSTLDELIKAPPYSLDEISLTLQLFNSNEIENFDLEKRLRIVSIIAAEGMNTKLDRQKEIVRLINFTPSNQSDELLLKVQTNISIIEELKQYNPGLQSKILINQLISATDDGLIGFEGNNYQGLIAALIKNCNQSKTYNDKIVEFGNDLKNFKNHSYIYNYQTIWTQFGNSLFFDFAPLFNFDPTNINTEVTIIPNSYPCKLKIIEETCIDEKCKTSQDIEFSYFDPVWFTNKSSLPLLKAISGPEGQWLPAIVAKYADDKGDLEDTKDAASATVDAISIFTGIAEINAGIKGLRLAYTLTDIASSSVSLIDNTSNDWITNNYPSMAKANASLGLFIGLVGITDMTLAGINKNNPSNISINSTYNIAITKTNIDPADLKNKAAAYLTNLENASDDILKWNQTPLQLRYDHQTFVEFLAMEAKLADDINLTNRCKAVLDKIRQLNKFTADLKIINCQLSEGGIVSVINGRKIAEINDGVLKIEDDVLTNFNFSVNNTNSVEIPAVNKIAQSDITTSASNIKLVRGEDGKYYCEGEGSFCFISGTKIKTQQGYKNIEDIKIGDSIYAYNHSEDKNTLDKTVTIFKNITSKLVKIYIGGTIIMTTPSHPIFANGKYIDAEKIKKGNKLTTFSGNHAIVDSVATIDSATSVYNFETKNFSNYFISSNEVLVHNSCGLKNIYSVLEDRTDFKNKLRKLSFAERNEMINELIEISTANGILDKNLLLDNVNKYLAVTGKVLATNGDELLALGKNIFKGSDEMLQTAAARIAKYRADMKGVKKLGGNLGYVEGEVNGVILSDELVSSATAPANAPEIFVAKYVNSQNQIKTSDIEGAYLRTGDSEFQMLTNVAQKFGLQKGKVYTEYSGTIKVISELPYCASCSGVIQQFSEMLPNVKIIIVNGAK